ncbi:MAG: AAA family ATPase, partial [Thermoguttaceae bacterium]
MLSSFEIRHFRTFSHLVIERLGQVNLIVGKNNVGKTCLLEALRLYDARGAARVIESILVARNEVRIDRERECAAPMLDMLFNKTSEPGEQKQFG